MAGAPPPPAPPAGYQPAPQAYQPYGAGIQVPAGTQLSSAGKRFGAYLLDGLLAIVTLIIGYLIWLLIVWGRGQTPAKQILKMRVVQLETQQAAGWGEMALRDFVVKGLLFGFVGALVTGGIAFWVGAGFVFAADRQALWDKMCKTIVVDDPDAILAPDGPAAAPQPGF